MLNAIRLRSRRLLLLFILSLCVCGSSHGGEIDTTSASNPLSSTSQAKSISTAAVSSAAATTVTRYVNPSHVMARDSGPGTAAAPYQTIGYAIRQLMRGDTLLISPGTYRESIDFRTAAGLTAAANASAPRTRISGSIGSTVIKGSNVVDGWRKLSENTFIRDNWPINSQQVFVDGLPLKQIGGSIFGGYPDNPSNAYASILSGTGGIWPGRIEGNASALVDNSFYYDMASESLYVRVPLTTLSGHIIEVSTRTYGIFGDNVSDISIENLRVEHSNTTATQQNGAVTLTGSRLVLDRVDVKYADGAGFDLTADDSTMQNGSATYCGQVGIKFRGARSRLLNYTISYNNTRGFNKWWEAGGAKFVGNAGLRDSVIANNRAYFNSGDGLWFDYKNDRNKIYGNSVAYNTGMGVQYEASAAAQIYRNRIFGNGQRGIYLPNGSKSVIAHNLVVYNGLEGIAIVDERGAVQNNTPFIPADNYVAANILGWNGKAAIVLPGAGVLAESEANLFLGLTPPTFSLGWASPTNPLIYGIAAWIGATRHDMESWHSLMVEPAALSTAIRLKNTAPDFSAIDSVAAGYTVPLARLPQPVPSVVTTKPGP